jgi:NAD(P)H dehydrogenase (quinone)
MSSILVLVHSKKGSTFSLAKEICTGVEKCSMAEPKLRRVEELKKRNTIDPLESPYHKIPVVQKKDVIDCDALIMGSPTRFGNMSAELKHFVDQTLDVWISGDLTGKVGAVFTSTGSLHGGQESTLISMMLPLLHHGMILAGIPYSEPQLSSTLSGGTPYGASHVSFETNKNELSKDEVILAQALGERVARITKKLTEK